MNRSRPVGDAAGPHNAIVDVAGVSVGHVDIRTPDLHTGLTAIVPYPAAVAERKLFIGRFSIDGGDAMSGLGVAEDFGTFSSPIVLAPTPVVGRVYESLIRHSLGRDTGLSTVAGWPPVVVGIDDTAVNDPVLVRKVLTHAHADEALTSVGSAVPTRQCRSRWRVASLWLQGRHWHGLAPGWRIRVGGAGSGQRGTRVAVWLAASCRRARGQGGRRLLLRS